MDVKKRIEELEEKITRQNQAIEAYREQLTRLGEYKSERDLHYELSSVLAFSSNFNEVFKKTLEILSLHLKARYYGVFWLHEEKELLTLRLGKGYNPQSMSEIPLTGSLMGESLFRKETLWEPHFNDRTDIVDLNQNPAENNVLCAPMILANGDEGVIRLANIDPSTSEKAIQIIRMVVPLLCATMERLTMQLHNERTLRSLDASFAIARLLEDTLNKQDILKKVCTEIPRLFPCMGCMLALRNGNGEIAPVMTWPEQFVLTGNRISGSIYLKNLLTAFPTGNGLIANIHKDDRRWSWQTTKVKSLCMAPIRIRNSVEGILIALGPPNETYDKTHSNLMGMVAAQTSMTLERASYLQQQEDFARCDGLTGLYNHRTFQDLLREEIKRTRRYNHPLSLIMLDIDHFKKFNDTYGHPIGDEVIKMTANTIKKMIRATDRAFRYGGEEFVLMLPETNCESGSILAERLRQKVECNRSVQNLSITISLGLTELVVKDAPESFIKRTDEALYKAKESGRNKTVALI